MTAPLAPASAPPPAYLPPHAPARPGGITFACVLSIVLGVLGGMFGMFFFVGSALLSLIPVAGPLLAAASGLVGAFLIAMGVLGVVAGAQGLSGASWARWTMVVLFAIGALLNLGAFAAVLPLAIVALNVAAIVLLVNAEATAWFDARSV